MQELSEVLLGTILHPAKFPRNSYVAIEACELTSQMYELLKMQIGFLIFVSV
jgi:hypothetical protein